MSSLTKLPSSKNSNFRRKDGHTQQGKWVGDNFIHYNLQDRVQLLAQSSVEAWLTHSVNYFTNSSSSGSSNDISSTSSSEEDMQFKEFEQVFIIHYFYYLLMIYLYITNHCLIYSVLYVISYL